MPRLAEGTKITCENGHHVATVNRSVDVGEILRPEQFDWLVPAPKDGTLFSECRCHCGARYVEDDGQAFHTPNGWVRP